MGLQLSRRHLSAFPGVKSKTVPDLLKKEGVGETVDCSLPRYMLPMFSALAEGTRFIQQTDVFDCHSHVETRLYEKTEQCLLYRCNSYAAAMKTLRMSSMEKKLRHQNISQSITDGQFNILLEEFNVVLRAVDRVAKCLRYLNPEFNSLEKNPKFSKPEYKQLLGSFHLFGLAIKEVTQ
uniref:Uncharacterized protein n=2 Tax=Physcomitrium patens TaxID=3218 RepID=A0A7I4A233_PHYPA